MGPTGLVSGGTVSVRQQDLTNDNRVFAFFQLITTQAPANATDIIVRFEISANGNQSLDLDDVSLFAI